MYFLFIALLITFATNFVNASPVFLNFLKNNNTNNLNFENKQIESIDLIFKLEHDKVNNTGHLSEQTKIEPFKLVENGVQPEPGMSKNWMKEIIKHFGIQAGNPKNKLQQFMIFSTTEIPRSKLNSYLPPPWPNSAGFQYVPSTNPVVGTYWVEPRDENFKKLKRDKDLNPKRFKGWSNGCPPGHYRAPSSRCIAIPKI